MSDAQLARAQAARQAHAADLMRKANVVGVGVGMRQRGGEQVPEMALVVLVRRKIPRSLLAEDDVVPGVIDGVPVDVVEVGDLRPG